MTLTATTALAVTAFMRIGVPFAVIMAVAVHPLLYTGGSGSGGGTLLPRLKAPVVSSVGGFSTGLVEGGECKESMGYSFDGGLLVEITNPPPNPGYGFLSASPFDAAR